MASRAEAMDDDRGLLERARGGDREAFRAVVLAHAPRAHAVALALTGNHHDAEDAVQEAMLRLYRALPSFRGDAALSTFLHRIVVNVCHEQHRRRSARLLQPLDEVPAALTLVDRGPDGDPERVAASRRLADDVARAMARLSPAERTVFVLRHQAGLPLVEVARLLGRADGTIRNLLHRALRKLRRHLAAHVDGRTEVTS